MFARALISKRQVAPSAADARQEMRYAWKRKVGDELLLRVPGWSDILVVSLFDVSPNGAGLATRKALPVGSDATILVKTNGVRLEFLATVAWCHELQGAELAEAAPNASGALQGIGMRIRGSGSFLAMLRAMPLPTRPSFS